MKSLIEFIKEAAEDHNLESDDIIRLEGVTIKYDVSPSIIYLELPDDFNESNVQEYMNDAWLEKLPSNSEFSEKFFKLNADNIADVYFEYDSVEHINAENVDKYNINPKSIIKIDSSQIEDKDKSEEIGLFKLTNLKYVIVFDRFDLNKSTWLDGTDKGRIKSTLDTIFKASESNSYNNYPIKIIYNSNYTEIVDAA